MDSSTQQKLTLVACRLLVIVIWVSTLVRPLFADQSAVFTLIGVVEGVIALLLYAIVRTELLGRLAPLVVWMTIPLLGIPLIMISGGVNSPYIYILPIFPFYTTLILGARFSWIATAVACVLILLLTVLSQSIVDITSASYSENTTRMRGFWIVLSLLAGVYISSSFSQLNNSLSKTLRDEANMDYLTRIANRRGLEKILDRESSSAQRHSSWLSIILLDVDDFKKYNDDFGHAAGDECLKTISSALRNASRLKQDYVGRWGGEEFIIIMPDTDPEKAKSVAELIRREIEFLDTGKNEDGRITATLGCCSAYGDETNIKEMIDTADRALYAGKARGKNRVIIGKIRSKTSLDD